MSLERIVHKMLNLTKGPVIFKSGEHSHKHYFYGTAHYCDRVVEWRFEGAPENEVSSLYINDVHVAVVQNIADVVRAVCNHFDKTSQE